MVTQISEKTIFSQLGGSYTGGIVMLGITAAVLGFCGVFCGTQLGWTNLLSVIFLAALAACIGFIIVLAVKMARVKKHPALLRCGSAAQLAARINEGLRNPRYLARSLDGNDSLVTLMTDDFIVSGLEFTGITELKEIRSMQATFIPKTLIVAVGNPLATAASLAMQNAGNSYWASKGVNENSKFDYLAVTDSAGKTRRFGVHHQDMEQVMTFMLQINPDIRIDPVARRL